MDEQPSDQQQPEPDHEHEHENPVDAIDAKAPDREVTTPDTGKDISRSRLTGLFDNIADRYSMDMDAPTEENPGASDRKRHTTSLDDDDPLLRTLDEDLLPPEQTRSSQGYRDLNATIAPEMTPPELKTCAFCQAPNTSGHHFCWNCGKPLRIEDIERCRVCTTPLVPDARYCYHCGSSVEPIPMLLLHLSESDMVFSLRGEKDTYSVGRTVTEQNNYVDIDLGPLGQRKVSRQHARILVKENKWYVEDLNSKGGTIIYNNRLKPQTPTLIEDGMVLYFADLKFRVEIQPS
ncbi:MAG TPA: FHA domain-containing protein [Aggregatilineales bacterium]|nr:FHA domain-containing protein [Aggregatilineales bacterium]